MPMQKVILLPYSDYQRLLSIEQRLEKLDAAAKHKEASSSKAHELEGAGGEGSLSTTAAPLGPVRNEIPNLQPANFKSPVSVPPAPYPTYIAPIMPSDPVLVRETEKMKRQRVEEGHVLGAPPTNNAVQPDNDSVFQGEKNNSAVEPANQVEPSPSTSSGVQHGGPKRRRHAYWIGMGDSSDSE